MDSNNVTLTTTGGTYTGQSSITIGDYWTNWPTTIGYWYPVTTEPTYCMGKAHVFECDHEPTCKCGKVQRVMEMGKKKGGGKRGC